MNNKPFPFGKMKYSRHSDKFLKEMTNEERSKLIPNIYPNVDVTRDVINSDSGDIFNLVEFLRFRDEVISNGPKKMELKIIIINFEGNIFISKLTYDGKNVYCATANCGGMHGYNKVYIYTGNAIIKEEDNELVSYYLVTKNIDRVTAITHMEAEKHKLISFRVCLPKPMQEHL